MNFLTEYLVIPFIVFIVAYLCMRGMGKKAASEMSGIDLMIVMIVGTTISEPIVTEKIGTAIWYSVLIVLFYILYSYLELANFFKRWITPTPTILIDQGEIIKTGMRRERIEVEELIAQMRIEGYTEINEIARATMEQTGEISFIPTEKARPLQGSDLKLDLTPTYIPIPLIIDGSVQKNNLHYINKDLSWLEAQLRPHNLEVQALDSIMLATYNVNGFLDLYRRQDKKNE
ncbi:DUF421 domain-containing protein [Jeotgalibacillus campisalis]|uniref:YetF C-terminal domain-containing protein n=1 Tax=Jeotgalibacillus campisalis TaxID=220754 RepID=A0A0C2SB23_9BACL|nr:YetF domain-containing protein [Jeotgalibacillus campisalis]KIL51149.1 hypothetical protein KR50_10300 [Jeotgalibacillus campisalis]